MKNAQKIDLGLTGYDELFMNEAERKENKLPRIYDIPISEIDDFPDHPFKVKIDEDMDQLVQSIKERGIITPVTLRPKEDGRYEIVSGHRRKKACVTGISNNIVIYGHHMKNGSMFADLCKYTDKEFYENHRLIKFDTLSSLGEYEVVAVFKFDTNHEKFKYNEYTQMDEEQFAEFMENVHARQLYDTGVDAKYGDQLLTLSTCEYTYDNGRLAVIAKRN